MSKPLPEAPSVRETMEEQIKRTMNVVQTIRGNTEKLLHKTESIIDILTVEASEKTEPETVAEAEAEVLEEGMAAEVISEVVDAVNAPNPAFVAEITRRCVKEVMDEINPVLHALNTFIKANSIDKKQEQEVDDEAFAAKLIEEMKSSLGRRQRIALARKRMTAP